MERTHICVRLRLREVSGCCVCVRASAFSSVRPRVCSMDVHAFRLRPCMLVCVRACAFVRVRVCTYVCVHIIKRPDASGRMKSFASGRVFRSRTFEMYYSTAQIQRITHLRFERAFASFNLEVNAFTPRIERVYTEA